MKAFFYIHGVPKGQDVWGNEQDRDYIKSFYSATYSENVRFTVEIIPAKKRAFYTYIRAKNVYGSENREGSYFGMTLSFDGKYCTDNESLFTLFDTIFNKRIVGSIILNNGGNFRFALPTFEGKSKELEGIQSEFLKQLESFDDDFESIDNSFTGDANGQIAYYNISDVDNTNFFSILKRTLKVYISPEYPTKDAQIATLKKQVDPEKAKNKQLTEDKAELEEKLSAATDKGKRNDSEIASLRSDKQKLEEETKKLRGENASLKAELERNRAKSSIERSVGQIRQPLEDLLNSVHKIAPVTAYDEPRRHQSRSAHDSESSDSNKKRIKVIDVITIITFILLIGLICLNYYHVDATTPIFHKKEVKKAPPKAPVKPYVRIQDIKDGESIEPNKEYTATLINPPEGKHIKWRTDGVSIPNGVRVENVLRFKPLPEKDTVYVTCCVVVNDIDSVIERKVWPIKK